MKRRNFLKSTLAGSAITLGAGLSLTELANSQSQPSGYKAVVMIFLNGGNDGNDIIVPTDGAFKDYQKARPSIALGSGDLTAFAGSYMGHSMGINNALSPLMPLFQQKRLAFLINAGTLVQPTSVSDVLNGRAKLPPFLFSHPEQVQTVMGWTGDEDQSGWGGRGIEAMAGYKSFKAPLMALDSSGSTLVTGQKSRFVAANSNFSRNLGEANLLDNTNPWTRTIESLTRLQSENQAQAEYARTFRASFLDGVELAKVDQVTPQPSGNFANTDIGKKLKFLARTMHYFRTAGASRQVFSVQWGGFDTHTNQRGATTNSGSQTQDTQLAELAAALTAFDDSIKAAGMDQEVVVLVASEFGRTLDPASGGGSDHAWGSHWWVIGGPVQGGQMLGQHFPSLVLRGVDDGDPGGRGYWVPQISSDQVAGELLTWLGVPQEKLLTVLPNLANFSTRKVGFIA
ncbi:DUF1501 domain-containing protein [Limnohabitans radicicola]|uniref:DUF1501 domain-containing protein n=1 Tax=Limnohabitans radicicola TaxID=2771427 RepID=A0A927FE60_9BURK|nr:DUF1501 domain-containing protein [Limnohabitans radicicola]MBD8049694.1 DUF1501 domain-containing protein [Limnohabitans radicicola]